MSNISVKTKKLIKEKKKWNERTEVFRYMVEYDQKYYHYVLFLDLLGMGTGSMVVEVNGNIPDRDTANKIIFRANGYANIMLYAVNELVKIKERKSLFLNKTIYSIHKYLNRNQTDFPREEIESFEIMAEEMIEGQSRLKEIYRSLEKLHNQVREIKNELTTTEFQYAYDLFLESQEILFRQGVTQWICLKTVPTIIKRLEKYGAKKNLINFLWKFADEKKKKLLKESMDSMIEPYIGDIYSIPYTEKGIKEFKRLKVLEGEVMHKEEIIPHIRN